MNPYLTEQLCRQRQAELLHEAQELRATQGLFAQPETPLARLRAWALHLVAGGVRERLWWRRGRRGQRQRA
jgi:hypothetical protein